MKSDRLQCAYVYQRSLAKVSAQSQLCLKSKNKEELWSTFIKSSLQLDNELTQKAEELLDRGKVFIDDQLKGAKDRKDSIDLRYD